MASVFPGARTAPKIPVSEALGLSSSLCASEEDILSGPVGSIFLSFSFLLLSLFSTEPRATRGAV